MTLVEKFKSWKKTEAEKLRPMSLWKKMEYIFHYYTWFFIMLAALGMVAFYVGDIVIQSQKEILLQGFFTNDTYNLFPASQIQQAYADTQDLSKDERIVFDDALYIDLGGEASDYTAASNGKMTAYIMMAELDFMVTSDEVIEYYKDSIPMMDLRELLPEEMQAELSQYFYYHTDENGVTKAIALEFTQSRYIAGTGADKEERVQNTYYFFVPYNAPHTEQILQFLTYSFDW